jgi:hypothetical protein
MLEAAEYSSWCLISLGRMTVRRAKRMKMKRSRTQLDKRKE